MSEDVQLVTKSARWSRADRAAFAGATVRVLGAVDRQGRLEVEITSGPLAGLRRWMREEELVRQEAAE